MSFPYQLLFQRRLYLIYIIRFSNYESLSMYSNSNRCQNLTLPHYLFLCSLEGSSCFQQSTGLFTSDDSFLFPSLAPRVYQSSPPLWTVRMLPPPLLCSPPAPPVLRYSSVREREMRGPFLISFLFSSFLLLFSSSLRIFWKASAV